jgi:hypothetical protein
MTTLSVICKGELVTLGWGAKKRYPVAVFNVKRVADDEFQCLPQYILRWKQPYAIKFSEDKIRIGSVVGTGALGMGKVLENDIPKGRGILGYADIDRMQVNPFDSWDDLAVGTVLDNVVIDIPLTHVVTESNLRAKYIRRSRTRIGSCLRDVSSLRFFGVSPEEIPLVLEKLDAIKNYSVKQYSFNPKNIVDVCNLPFD